MTDKLKPFLEDMLSMSTSADGRTLKIYFSRPVTNEDRQAFADAHNAIVRGELSPPPPPAPQVKVTAEEHNASFDLANDALGGAFKDGFREGWLFAKDPGFDDREDLEADYSRSVDIAPSECWDAYRSHYFAMLPLAAIPDVGEAFHAPTPQTPVASIVPPHCSGIAFVFEPGVLRVNKDGSGYIAIDEDDFALEDDRCEGPDGPEGSVHWIARLDASDITALRDFLNGTTAPAPQAMGSDE